MLESLNRVWKITKPHVFSADNFLNMGGSFLLSCVSTTLNLVMPFIFTNAVLALAQDEDEFELMGMRLHWASLVTLYGTAWCLSQSLPSIQRRIIMPMAIRIGNKMAFHYVNHVMNVPMEYHQNKSEVDKMEYFRKSLTGLQDMISQSFTQIMPISIEAIVSAGILSSRINYLAGATLIGMVSMNAIVHLSTTRVISIKYSKRYELDSEVSSKIGSVLGNYETVHMFNNADYEIQRLIMEMKKVLKKTNKALCVSDLVSIVQNINLGAGFSIILLLIANDVKNDFLQAEDFIFVTLYLLKFLSTLGGFGEAVNKIRTSFVDLEKTALFFEENPTQTDSSTLLSFNKSNADIVFDKVSFHYKDKVPVLNNVSMKIPAGHKVGIVGISGSGKTTITELLLRYFEPISGTITINGQDITTVSRSSIREKIGVVSQSPVLFNNTLGFNIMYGLLNKPQDQSFEDSNDSTLKNVTLDGEITSEETVDEDESIDPRLKQVIKIVNLNKYVSKQESGINTQIGNNGAKMSGGQKQRVAIARAMLKEPNIYIFDEATSALDPENEEKIQKNIDAVSEGVTTLVITHRLHTIKDAHLIFVLSEGQVIESGTHEELLALDDGYYAKLWSIYIQGYESDANRRKITKPEKSSSAYSAILTGLKPDKKDSFSDEYKTSSLASSSSNTSIYGSDKTKVTTTYNLNTNTDKETSPLIPVSEKQNEKTSNQKQKRPKF